MKTARILAFGVVFLFAGCSGAGISSAPTGLGNLAVDLYDRPSTSLHSVADDLYGRPYTACSSTATVLVPLYIYPGSAWTEVEHERQLHPSTAIAAIINPNNGPGLSKDPNYVTGVVALQKAGVIVLGYDHTSYSRRSIAAVERDARRYHSWYAVNGIFFDEMANTSGHEPYYSTVSAYAKSLGMPLTIGNPGTDTLQSYVGTVDTMVIYESAGYPPLSRFGGWHLNYPKSTWGSISYAVPTFDPAKVCPIAGVAGYIYVTDATLPNPYDKLPSYFDALVGAL